MRRLSLALLLVPALASAQRAITVRADNDAFNFWQAPWVRPDEEYTSGVRLVTDFDGAAPWARRLQRVLGSCGQDASPCAAHTYSLGQDIYTAVRPKYGAIALPGGRPDAGVLWLSSTTRVNRSRDVTELGWTIGVTGRPSLAESVQRLVHSIAPRLNHDIAWERQVPAEPVFAVSYDRRHFARTGWLELQPHAGASLGSLLTEARAGAGARLGGDREYAWRPPRDDRRLALSLEGDATVRAVARNEVLNGAFFRQSVRVAPRPLVSELQGGLHVRWFRIEAAWVAHQTGAEYVTRTTPHRWSTLEVTWWPSR